MSAYVFVALSIWAKFGKPRMQYVYHPCVHRWTVLLSFMLNGRSSISAHFKGGRPLQQLIGISFDMLLNDGYIATKGDDVEYVAQSIRSAKYAELFKTQMDAQAACTADAKDPSTGRSGTHLSQEHTITQNATTDGHPSKRRSVAWLPTTIVWQYG